MLLSADSTARLDVGAAGPFVQKITCSYFTMSLTEALVYIWS